MAVDPDDRALLVKALRATGPYLCDLVLIGGWAFRLYALRWGSERGLVPLATRDADLVLPRHPAARDRTLREYLEDEGFSPEFLGSDSPPVTHYALQDPREDFYIEFLVAQVGRPAAPTTEIAGVTAQRLRYLDLLTVGASTVELSTANGFDTGDAPLTIRIPNPVSFLAHKLLVLDERRPDKQQGDIIYIHDTLLLFADELDELRLDWWRLRRAMHPRWIARLDGLRRDVFARVTDRIRGAASVAASTGRNPPLDAERIRSACEFGLRQIFADGDGSASRAGERLERALARFDAVNAEDPRREDGEPTELAYGRRMTAWLERLAPDAPEELRLAVRAQHLGRWRLPRDRFPEGRAGYKRWRSECARMHADTAAAILEELGYAAAAVQRVRDLLTKKRLAHDPDVQTLEDVACLVFLEHTFADFARKHERDKLVDIVRKTWAKMSERGRAAAAGLALPPDLAAIVADALR